MGEKKNLEIIPGDGSNLDISPVHEHLSAGKPKSAKEKPTNIIIPKETNKTIKDNKNKKEEN